MNRGWAYHCLGDMQNALKDLNEMDEDEFLPQWDKFWVYCLNRKYKKAYETSLFLEKEERTKGQLSVFETLRAFVAFKTAKAEKGEEYLEAAKAAAGDVDDWSLINVVEAHVRQENPESAYRDVLDYFPTHRTAMLFLGEYCVLNSKLELLEMYGSIYIDENGKNRQILSLIAFARKEKDQGQSFKKYRQFWPKWIPKK